MDVGTQNKKRESLIDDVSLENEYFAYTAEGLSFLGHSKDEYIIRRSYIDNTIWGYNSLQWLYRLARQYYDIDNTKFKYFSILAPISALLAFLFIKNWTRIPR